MTCPLFNGLRAFFQLKHFSVQDTVALQQAFVFGTLVGNLLGQLFHLRKAAITDP